MTIFNKVLIIALPSFALFIFMSLSYAQGDGLEATSDQVFSNQIKDKTEMRLLIKENKRCIRCHQKKRLLKGVEAITSVGAHSSKIFFDNCTACHGSKGLHPKDGIQVLSYSENSLTSVINQNEQCIGCHSTEKLREVEWTHDVHFAKINCSSCHDLHNDVDSMKEIGSTDRILMCIDCHGI